MKKSYLFIIGLALSWPVLIASENGVAEDQNKDRTGAPGSDNACNNATCHTAGAFSPTTTIEILDDNSIPISQYVPGNTYTMKVTITAGSGNPAVYGFQGTAVSAENAGNAGMFQNPGASVQLESVGGRHIVEHSAPNPANFFEVEWVAPTTGFGDVGFYVSAIAANNSGSDSGDGYDGAVLTIAEDTGSQVALLAEAEPMKIRATMNGTSVVFATSGKFMLYDLNGRVIMDQHVSESEELVLPALGQNAVIRLNTEKDTYSRQILL